MFAQFRAAAESLAQQPQPRRKPSNDANVNGTNGQAQSPRGSLDVHDLSSVLSSTEHLAESAFSSLRKTLTARSESPSGERGSPPPGSIATRRSQTKMSLEERLRLAAQNRERTPDRKTPTSPPPRSSTMSPVLKKDFYPLLEEPDTSSDTATKQPSTPDASKHMDETKSPEPGSKREEVPISVADAEGEAPPVRETKEESSSSSIAADPESTPELPSVSTSHSVGVVSEDNEGDNSSLERTPADHQDSGPASEASDNTSMDSKTEAVSLDDLKVDEPLESSASHTNGDEPAASSPVISADSASSVDVDQAEVAVSSDAIDTEDKSPAEDSPSNEQPAVEVVESQSQSPGLDVEALTQNLRLLEQRFNDVSESFERLQAEKAAAIGLLEQIDPSQALDDSKSLPDHLNAIKALHDATKLDVKTLAAKLRTTEERIEEMRDTHRMESHSQSGQIDRLRKQIEETELLYQSSQSSSARAADDASKQKAEIDRMEAEVKRAKEAAKAEEEKRVKAIELLKAVRQKLVKAEKERDEAIKIAASQNKEQEGRDKKERDEKAALEAQVQQLRAEKERELAEAAARFDRELQARREEFEKDLTTRKSLLDQQLASARADFQKELAQRGSQISTLENSVRSLVEEKDNLFDKLQMRQAELESSQSHLETLRNNASELRFQLRDATESIALLKDELADARREKEHELLRSPPPRDDSVRTIAALEAKYKSQLTDLQSRLAVSEQERNDTEATLSRTLKEKTEEIASLRQLAESATRSKRENEEALAKLRQEAARRDQDVSAQQALALELDEQSRRLATVEALYQQQTQDAADQLNRHKQEMEEAREKEKLLRNQIKSIREELRKVQSSAALLERRRGAGVGFRPPSAPPEKSASGSGSPGGSAAASPTPPTQEQEVSLEYMRHVVLQFLEHKEMRPQLVKVLSVILQFTPQETRRLAARI